MVDVNFFYNWCFNSEPGQGTNEEHKGKDHRRELEDRERQSRRDKEKVTQCVSLIVEKSVFCLVCFE